MYSKFPRPTKTFNDTLTLGAINSNFMKSRSTTKLDANGPSISLKYLFTVSSSCEDMENEVVIRCVLAKKRRSNRFSERVKSFLVEQFMIGEETGRKVTQVEAATRMRSPRNETGNRKFGKGEWLIPQQITSYFSRLAAMKKSAIYQQLQHVSKKKMLKRWWSGLRDTTSAKELTTNLPHYSLFSVFFLHEHRKDKS